jgi:hypothetical protein
MRDGAPPFSVMDFVWEEIKGTLPHVHYRRCNQSKLSKGRVPHAFQAQSYQEASDPIHITSPSRAELTPHQQQLAKSVRSIGSNGQTSLGDQGQSSSQQHEKFSSPIKKMFGLLFGMCRSHHAIEARLHEERKPERSFKRT